MRSSPMSSPTSRSTELAVPAALWLALGAAGCSSEGAHAFAVTLTDASALTCRVEASGTFDEGLAAGRIAERENAYAAYRAAAPAEPEGHQLYVVATGEQLSAWFEASPSGTTPPGADAVFGGLEQDDFVELRHMKTGHVTTSTGAVLEGGPVVLEHAVLTLTLVDAEVRGRVHVLESSYGVGATADPPDTHVVCARDVQVRGAELP